MKKTTSETLKIASTKCTCYKFGTYFKALFKKTQNQGGKVVVLERTLPKYFSCPFEV